VVALQSSREAIEEIKREKPDLILLDIVMPDKDGYQVCEEIRCDDLLKHLPVIVFTAKPLEKTFIDKAYEFYGATDYLSKPFDAKELFKKIEKYLK
jgi:CheY-like chemotaxis protein